MILLLLVVVVEKRDEVPCKFPDFCSHVFSLIVSACLTVFFQHFVVIKRIFRPHWVDYWPPNDGILL